MTHGGQVLIGPRTGSKTAAFAIPDMLPPGPLQPGLPLKIVRVESLRDDLHHSGDSFTVSRWLEHVETALEAEECLTDGRGVVFACGNLRYLAAWPDAALLERLFVRMAQAAGLATVPLPADLRVRRTKGLTFAFNYGPDTIELPKGLVSLGCFVLGSAMLPPAGIAVWSNMNPSTMSAVL